MAQYRRPAVLLVQELVHEDMHGCTERVQREISHVLSKGEQGKCRAEGQMGKRRLYTSSVEQIQLLG